VSELFQHVNRLRQILLGGARSLHRHGQVRQIVVPYRQVAPQQRFPSIGRFDQPALQGRLAARLRFLQRSQRLVQAAQLFIDQPDIHDRVGQLPAKLDAVRVPIDQLLSQLTRFCE
jgi:hypothetical protein